MVLVLLEKFSSLHNKPSTYRVNDLFALITLQGLFHFDVIGQFFGLKYSV